MLKPGYALAAACLAAAVAVTAFTPNGKLHNPITPAACLPVV